MHFLPVCFCMYLGETSDEIFCLCSSCVTVRGNQRNRSVCMGFRILDAGTIRRKQSVFVVSGAGTGLSCGKPVGVICRRCTNDYTVGSTCYNCKCAIGYVQRHGDQVLRCITKRYRDGTVATKWRTGLDCRKGVSHRRVV